MYRRTMRFASVFATLSILFIAMPVDAADADKHAATIAPYLDDQTILVAHVDVSRIDVDAAVAMLSDFIPADGGVKKQIDSAAFVAKAWLAGFQKAGGRDIFAAISISDIGRDGAPDLPFFLVIPLADEGNSTAIAMAIPTNNEKNFPLQITARIPDGGPFVFGSRVTIDRIKTLRAERQVANAALADAFEAVDRSAVQVVFIPTDDHRRVIREMFPKLPKPLDAIDGPTLADGILWKAVGIDLPPEFGVRSVVRAKDAATAERLAAGWKQLLDFVAAEPKVREHVPMIDKIVPLLQPTVEGDWVVVAMKQDSIVPIVKQMLVPALTAARSAAKRQVRANQFKQLALAMHNWADAHGKKVDGKRRIAAFPPAAIYSEDGKPLLSWRVALLPYFEQQSLYDQFHLDEPWDSEHNMTLIKKMPDLFKDHELAGLLGDDRIPPGHTTYVVPVSEGLVFGRKEGTAFKEITDGTSNTIMIVEVVPELAVPWTKPADWEVDLHDPLKGVKRTDRGWFTEAHCDGSVRIIANDVDPNTLRAMLTRAGEEVIER